MATLTVPVTNPRKPWYMSRTMWGAILAGTAGLITAVVPTVDPSAPAWVHTVFGGLSTAGGILAFIGRQLSTVPPQPN